jgi:hypothetical protein
VPDLPEPRCSPEGYHEQDVDISIKGVWVC